ncbi:PEP-CTERM protein-sorting domain-containing protein [Terrimicrobium sacchariphilum]|uniref:PEP-CTERM protein-sorting domain-containing protein n=1 Tax=Terrimicrobium sacchariphilum TaxID=690879 RepID=A0A146G7J0_TERSA|nr:PEP-CTERM sorting domain-containing protein [Terrimicrobium sacchariphilum]GAT32884.1 PEP-CTERM protein-sorting domain-containing protein [Terrimicrobium sacchariphilum]
MAILIATIGLPLAAGATVLTSGSFSIVSGSGNSPAAKETSCMIMSNGTSWAGGAEGVQGSASLKSGGGSALAANVAFKFNIGSFVDSLNSVYGPGNWAVSNVKLSFQYTLYSNNTRFNSGAGTFDIYWVANDSWAQIDLDKVNSTTPNTNPAYATNAAGLSNWSGGQALLASEYYDWTTPGYTGTAADLTSGKWSTDSSGTRQSTLSYDLGSNASFLGDILTASSSGDSNISLYLMSTSDTMGITIFTGGGTSLPTLTFDVVSVPEPGASTLILLGAGSGVLLWRSRRSIAAGPDTSAQ